ncbi:MAG: TetR/AcrR family transcriptional regulator [Alphaproteobacteria bacterium]|nr:TetR/AcrR family transcriptional regulator [Alphaproteobacteria bacterium]
MRKPTRDRKVEILTVALGLAFEVGPDMVTTGRIAERLGLSQPAIYKHFPSKIAIWSEIATDLGVQIKANVVRAQASEQNPVDEIRMQIRTHLELIEGAPALPDIMVHRDLRNPQHAALDPIREAMRDFHAALLSQVDTAQRQGLFAREINTGDATTLILGVIQSLVLKMMVTRQTAHLSADGKRLLDLLLAGFSPQRSIT